MSQQDKLTISDDLIQNAYHVLKSVGEKQKEEKKQQLINDEKVIELTIKYDLEGEKKSTPRIVELKHSLFSAEDGDSAILLLSHNDKTTKPYLEEHPIPGLSKVTSMDKVRETFATYEQKRNLLRSYSRFLCDQAISPMMGSILGKKCYEWNKLPFPVNIGGKETLEKRIQSALSSTMYLVNCSTTLSIKVGKESFTDEQIIDNVHAVLVSVYQNIPVKNILAISFSVIYCFNSYYLQCNQSLSIPFYEKPAVDLLKECKKDEKKVEEKIEKKEKTVKKEAVEKKTKKSKSEKKTKRP